MDFVSFVHTGRARSLKEVLTTFARTSPSRGAELLLIMLTNVSAKAGWLIICGYKPLPSFSLEREPTYDSQPHETKRWEFTERANKKLFFALRDDAEREAAPLSFPPASISLVHLMTS